MFCRNCGTENEEGAKFCRSCGNPIVPAEEIASPAEEDVSSEADAAQDLEEKAFEAETVEQGQTNTADTTSAEAVPPVAGYSEPAYNAKAQYNNQPQFNNQAQQNVQPQNTNTTIGALVLGILSIVCCCSCFIGLGCGIAAIIMSVNERKKGTDTSMTTVALILGIVGVALSVIAGIWSIVTGALAGLSDGTFFNRIRNPYGFNSYDYWS